MKLCLCETSYDNKQNLLAPYARSLLNLNPRGLRDAMRSCHIWRMFSCAEISSDLLCQVSVNPGEMRYCQIEPAPSLLATILPTYLPSVTFGAGSSQANPPQGQTEDIIWRQETSEWPQMLLRG